MQLLTIVLIALGFSQVDARFKLGECPKLDLESNFSLKKYEGRWFELARDKQTPYEKGECVHGDYKLEEDGTLRIRNFQYVTKKRSTKREMAEGRAICANSLCFARFRSMGDNFGDY